MLGLGLRSAMGGAVPSATALALGPIEALAVPALLERSVTRFPAQPALSFMGRRWSYAALGEWVARAARGLQDLGVRKGDRVGLCLPNTPYSVVFYYAALQAGAVVVNFNPLYVPRELKHQITDSETTVMVVPDLAMICDKVREVATEAGIRRIIVCPMAAVLPPAKAALYRLMRRRETASLTDDPRMVPHAQVVARAAPPDPVPIDPMRDIAVLQYTGGTTGVPKGAMLTHANLTINAQQVSRHMPGIRLGAERMLAVLPFFHVFAMTAVMNSGIEVGAELLLHPRFEIRSTMRALMRDRPTILHGVPTIYHAIAGVAEKKRCDIGSLRVCISGGAPLPAEVRVRFEHLTGCKLVEGYGLTEASPVLACNPPEGRVKDGSVGIPMAGTTIEIRDLADPRRMLPPGERGEVCARGPQVMRGYWNRPDDTVAAFVDGALRTGDVGHLDDDGYLYITDRIKDVILCGGYNVYPRVIEEALYQHPAVAEAVVIGVADEYRGQAPKAFVTLHPGKAATPGELRDFLAGYVSKIEMPREVEIRTSLPHTPIGKLSRKELIAEEEGRT
jgi:long-chain acyl-CoA synthetase